jgi:hypothetical protein
LQLFHFEVQSPSQILHFNELVLNAFLDQEKSLHVRWIRDQVLHEAPYRHQNKLRNDHELDILSVDVVVHWSKPLAGVVGKVVREEINPRAMDRVRTRSLDGHVENAKIKILAHGRKVREILGVVYFLLRQSA